MSHASLILPNTVFIAYFVRIPPNDRRLFIHFPHLHERNPDADPTHDANVVHNDVLQLAKAPAGVDDLGDLEKTNGYPYKKYKYFN